MDVHQKRILIVDKEGFKADTAIDGIEAISMIKERDYNVFIVETP